MPTYNDSFSPPNHYAQSDYTEASTLVTTIAKQLIRAYHPWLRDANIGFLFRKESQTSKGRAVIASAMKVPDKFKLLLNLDYLIWISEEDWKRLTEKQQEALVDHELCHCVVGPNGFTIRGHDVEEFHDVIQRHGLWRQDVRKMYDLARQQQALPGLESVELSTGGQVVTLTAEQFAAAANQISSAGEF